MVEFSEDLKNLFQWRNNQNNIYHPFVKLDELDL